LSLQEFIFVVVGLLCQREYLHTSPAAARGHRAYNRDNIAR